ncbi:MAG: hypothetical protein IPG79_16810 [Saprospiraceae bacterium]|nr:hypothetical protein [Saprospiraceae bacterium]
MDNLDHSKKKSPEPAISADDQRNEPIATEFNEISFKQSIYGYTSREMHNDQDYQKHLNGKY